MHPNAIEALKKLDPIVFDMIDLLEDDHVIEVNNLSICKLRKDPNTGWLLDETVYQVTFYDKIEDFEISNIYESIEDAVLMFVELRNITTVVTQQGFRIKSPKEQYNKIFSFKPSAYGEVGKRKLLTRKKKNK